MSVSRLPLRVLGVVITVVVVLAASSAVAIAAGNGAFEHGVTRRRCSAPALPGTMVGIVLGDMGQMMEGGSMMGGGSGMVGAPMMNGARMPRGMLWITSNRRSVPAGQTSFLVTNRGAMTHEFIVLRLRNGETIGRRRVGAHDKVDESASVGEASRSCGAGKGAGIAPGTMSWVTLSLTSGRYELICNQPGHYAAGMFTELTVV